MNHTPSIAAIRATAERLRPYLLRTPSLDYYGSGLPGISSDSSIALKLELLQRTGSFKPRGAINVMLHFDDTQRKCGVTAMSAGNHAIATAYAARTLGIDAKVAMPKTANPFRVARCKALGADIVFAEDIAELFDIVAKLQEQEGRVLVHPFEGQHTFEGTGTVGLEFIEDVPDLEAVVVPIGGGGLIAGVASAIKQIKPECAIYGVEPEGASGMSQCLSSGQVISRVNVDTIADSLGAPMHTEGAYTIIRDHVDDVVTVCDAALAKAMKLTFTDLKLAVEPAGAAALAATIGPLSERLSGKKIGIIVCGSNIDLQSYNRFVEMGG